MGGRTQQAKQNRPKLPPGGLLVGLYEGLVVADRGILRDDAGALAVFDQDRRAVRDGISAGLRDRHQLARAKTDRVSEAALGRRRIADRVAEYAAKDRAADGPSRVGFRAAADFATGEAAEHRAGKRADFRALRRTFDLDRA